MPVDAAARRPAAGLARLGFSLAAGVIVVDQITKWLVLSVAGLSPPGCRDRADLCERIELSPLIDLSMVWNEGVSFGLFQANALAGRILLMTFSIAIAGLLSHWLRTVKRPLSAIALGGIIGGAIGNFIDRARFGAVVDFIDASDLWFPWVFNVADAAISVGVALLLIDLALEERGARRTR